MAKCWVSVAIARPLMGLFDYECEEDVAVGARVTVPFAQQKLTALVMRVSHQPPEVDFALKTVIDVLDEQPIVGKALLSLLSFASHYYQHPIGEVVQAALPKILRDGGRNERQLVAHFTLSPLGKKVLAQKQQLSGVALGAKQLAVLQRLSDTELSYAQLKEAFALSPAWLNNLVARKWLSRTEKFSTPQQDSLVAPALTPAQAQVLTGLVQQQHFSVSVLDGVTGSGKTEVYIRLIEQWSSQQGQILVLVPEIGLVQTMLNHLRARLSLPVVAHHSGLTDKQRLGSWQAIAAGDAQVLVGTRSAVFSEFRHLVGIIIDEEHDPAYKQQDGFRYHARDLAIVRAKQADIPIILGSATPLLETYHHLRTGKWQHFVMPERVKAQSLPSVTIDNTEHTATQGGLSVGLIRVMRATLAENKQVMLFLNRRGYAPILRCEACGWQSDCEACDAVMTAHTTTRELICHHCGRKQRLPVVCPACHKGELNMLGMGTQKLEQTVKAQFPHANVLRIDSDAFTTANQFEQALASVQHNEVDIILGTQWLSKGHHFPRLTLVAIIDADQALYSMDFRSEERLAQMLVQVSGRAGRESSGRVWVQTRQPGHPVFTSLSEPYIKQLERLYAERAQAQLPPCSAQALLYARHKDLARAMHTLEMTKQGAQAAGIGVDWLWLGPAPAVMARKDGQHRAQLLLQTPDKHTMHKQLHLVNQWLLAQGKANGVRCGLDVDPLWLE